MTNKNFKAAPIESVAGWREVVTTSVATLPRLGWRGRWDALLYALRIHRFLRVEEAPLKLSAFIKCKSEVKLDIAQMSVEVDGPYSRGPSISRDPRESFETWKRGTDFSGEKAEVGDGSS